MNSPAQWLKDLGETVQAPPVEGLVAVSGYQPDGGRPEEVVIIEKAQSYGAHAVFFEAAKNGRPSIPQAFIFISDGADDEEFAELHRRLWSWGGVPLVYRKSKGVVQLFRCAHKEDFIDRSGRLVCKPVSTLHLASTISADPWWNVEQLSNGTIWDNAKASQKLVSAKNSAHKRLIEAVEDLNTDLNEQQILPQHLRRKLLIQSLLIAYLEARGIFETGYFERFLFGADHFFEILADGQALVRLLDDLEIRFNGGVFTLSESDRDALLHSAQLARFAQLIEGKQAAGGQLTLWHLYSFKDLPVELISHIYQRFIEDESTAVYTPPFLVRFMLEEALSWQRIDRLHDRKEVLLDPSCGSGVFLVESYKRLVLHWRSHHGWQRPSHSILEQLLYKVQGIDKEEDAIELAAFSLYLALCDALEPEDIRAQVKLFPVLVGKTLHRSCYFEGIEKGLIKDPIGVVVGNPPFISELNTLGAKRSYERYQTQYGQLPDKNLAYLFLHDAMNALTEGGLLCLLQQYNFLYGMNSRPFRQRFFSQWDVREILDLASIRGIFGDGGADTFVVVVVAVAEAPPEDRMILHATFRRSGRVDAKQGFDIDHYDLHWMSRELILRNPNIWRANLLGGERVQRFVEHLKSFRTLGEYAREAGWLVTEGFVAGKTGKRYRAPHIAGQPVLPTKALTVDGIDVSQITNAPDVPIKNPKSPELFTPPVLLIGETMDLPVATWSGHYLAFKQDILGFKAPPSELKHLQEVEQWVKAESVPLRAYIASTSPRLFLSRATAILSSDIRSLPFPENKTLDLSLNEKIIADDIVHYYRDFIRYGEDSGLMMQEGHKALADFNCTFTRQINAIYGKNPLIPLTPYTWPGIICQPFSFGDGEVDWSGAEELRDKLDALLRERNGLALQVTRIARMYDRSFVFLLKPDRMRYWLRSIALRDADDTLADLRAQGF